MSKHCSLQETAALLQAANKIVLCSHVSPDGDTLGSALSLMKALQKLGKDVIVTVDDEISKVYKFLPGIESFVRFQNDERIAADLLVVIDASSLDRAGNVSQCVSAPKTLNIDHHISNTEYADYLYLDTAAAATGEIMYELIYTLGVEVDLEMATCIYTALYTDCGSFKYSNTMPKTMRIAAALLEIGVKPNEISDSMEIKPRSNIEMLTKVLETLTFDADGKIAYISINNEMYDKDVDTDTFNFLIQGILKASKLLLCLKLWKKLLPVSVCGLVTLMFLKSLLPSAAAVICARQAVLSKPLYLKRSSSF